MPWALLGCFCDQRILILATFPHLSDITPVSVVTISNGDMESPPRLAVLFALRGTGLLATALPH